MSVAGVINGLTLGGTTAIVDGVQSSHVVSSETVVATYSIPANTFKEGDILQVQGGFLRNSTSGSLSVRLYWNNTPDLNSASQLASVNTGSTNEYIPLTRSIAIVSATTSLVVATNSLFATDFTDVNQNEAPFTATVTDVNWSIDGYFVISMDGVLTGVKYYFKVII